MARDIKCRKIGFDPNFFQIFLFLRAYCMKPRTSALFHFTKNEEILFDIMKNGFWPRYCLEDLNWHMVDNYSFVAFSMVCFCDIPLSRISEHVKFYGSFGIGLSKEWGEKNNLNPVFYLSPGSELSASILQIFSHSMSTSSNRKSKAVKDLRYLTAYIKPTAGNMMKGSEEMSKEFYQESEWRYIPKHDDLEPYLTQENFHEAKILEICNDVSKANTSLEFTPNDVSYIFVPKDSYIPSVINFIQNELDTFPSADLKLLYSRVISIENIERDM